MARRADRPMGAYSKGMLQRVSLAQALLGEPELLVLDEPMSGLDPVGRRDVRDIILAQARSGTTVFFSSHITSTSTKKRSSTSASSPMEAKASSNLRPPTHSPSRPSKISAAAWSSRSSSVSKRPGSTSVAAVSSVMFFTRLNARPAGWSSPRPERRRGHGARINFPSRPPSRRRRHLHRHRPDR